MNIEPRYALRRRVGEKYRLEAADAEVHKGADDHIMKPVNLHLLRSIINDLVE